MSVPAPSARSRFTAALRAQDADLDLAAAALLIAAEEYPQLTPDPYLRRLDLLAERARDRLADESAPLVVLQELSRVLFVEERFRGNLEAYHDPRNSFLNDVLDRRAGIPITLGVVYLEVGWRLGLPLAGVNFPGHFVVRYDGEALTLLVDPFHDGEIRFADQAQELLDRVYGGTVAMRSEFLRSAGKRDVLARILTNLKGIYVNAGDTARAIGAIERILLIRPESLEEVRDRGMILARAGRVEEAAADLRRYLEEVPDAPDARRVQTLLERLAR